MAKTALCTISTRSHLFKSKVLLQSVRRYSQADLFCLVTDADEIPPSAAGETYHTLEVLDTATARSVKKKYRGDRLRWACKPLYLLYLLQAGYERVIYVDNDICFFSSPDFLFDALGEASVLLTPHHYPRDPGRQQNWLEANYRVGLYNAGFVGVSGDAADALEWWAACCLYNIRKSAWRGLFDDQKYLDLMPVAFPGVRVLDHKGCNVAGWNTEVFARSLGPDGNLLIDGKWPLVFVHFASLTFRQILQGNDPLLEAPLRQYVHELRALRPSYAEQNEIKRTWKDYPLYLRHIRWRIIRLFE